MLGSGCWALTIRTYVLVLMTHDNRSSERRGRPGVPPGTLGKGSSALGNGGRRGAGNRSESAAGRRTGGLEPPGVLDSRGVLRCPGGLGVRRAIQAPGRAVRRESRPDRFRRPGRDPRIGRPAEGGDHCPSRRRDQWQDDAGAAGRRPGSGRGRAGRLPGPGQEPRSGRGGRPGRAARVAGRPHAGFARRSSGDGGDAPPGPNGRPAGAGPAEPANRWSRAIGGHSG